MIFSFAISVYFILFFSLFVSSILFNLIHFSTLFFLHKKGCVERIFRLTNKSAAPGKLSDFAAANRNVTEIYLFFIQLRTGVEFYINLSSLILVSVKSQTTDTAFVFLQFIHRFSFFLTFSCTTD